MAQWLERLPSSSRPGFDSRCRKAVTTSTSNPIGSSHGAVGSSPAPVTFLYVLIFPALEEAVSSGFSQAVSRASDGAPMVLNYSRWVTV